jgi:hypothetical protein
MKKVLCVALASMVCVAVANADDLTLRTEVDGLTYEIYGTVTSSTGFGLALWSVDLDWTTGTAATPAAAGPGMGSFVLPDGLTNPDGYGGTLIGGDLIQVGGASNTIGNTPDNADYPIGTVVEDIGLSEILLASGECADGDVIEVVNCFANYITGPGVGTPMPVYPVDDLPVANCADAGLTIECGGALPPCADADVNCDGFVDATDQLVIQNPANWNVDPNDAGNPRADVNEDGYIDATDQLVIQNPANWNTTTGDCWSSDCP